VCGEDGQSYENACTAQSSGIRVVRDGMCIDGVVCPEDVEAVECLANPCAATTCLAGTIATPTHCGECGCECKEPDDSVLCTMEYAPVCGVDGKTYDNKCFARAARVDIAHDGACESKCLETEQFMPGGCWAHDKVSLHSSKIADCWLPCSHLILISCRHSLSQTPSPHAPLHSPLQCAARMA
jgi:hypothetical protein